MAPKVSIVIPVYNRAHSVLPTLLSVQAQTLSDFECIIIDDGSRDGDELRAVVQGLGDSRFRYVWRENGGGGAARNTGIDESAGDVVAFLDSDDHWLPEKLEVQVAELRKHPDRVCYCQCLVDRGVAKRWIRPSRGIAVGEDVGEYLFVSNEFIPTPTIALSTSIAREIRWDPRLRKGQDLDFVLRLASTGHQFTFVRKPLVIWEDISEAGRTSHASGKEALYQFLTKNSDLLTLKARRGFEASYLAHEIAKTEPAKALSYLASAARSGVPLSIVARQLLRAFLPRRAYRQLVNAFVTVAGK